MDELRKREKECRRLKHELETEKEKFNQMVAKYQADLQNLQATLYEESQARLKLSMELDTKESEVNTQPGGWGVGCKHNTYLPCALNTVYSLHKNYLFRIIIKTIVAPGKLRILFKIILLKNNLSLNLILRATHIILLLSNLILCSLSSYVLSHLIYIYIFHNKVNPSRLRI